MPAKEQVAPRKQQLIDKSQRTMFFWIAGVAAVVGICGVVSYSLWKQLEFRTSVVNAKNDTVNTLKQNNSVVSELRQNVQKLETDTNLNALRVNDEKAIQVILDALPATGNSLALGASLQKNLTEGVDGLTIQSLSVTPTPDEIAATTDGSEATTSVDTTTDAAGGDSNTVSLQLVAESSNSDALKQLLGKFERSIRVIDIDSLKVDRSEDKYTMTLSAHAYYQPAKVIELTNKTVTSKSGGK